MQPLPESVTLNDICITQELSARSPRPANWQARSLAMQSLARQMAIGSQTVLQSLVEIAADLCQAGTAGISLLETTDAGEEVFRSGVASGRATTTVTANAFVEEALRWQPEEGSSATDFVADVTDRKREEEQIFSPSPHPPIPPSSPLPLSRSLTHSLS